MWHFCVGVFENVQTFLPPKHFLQDVVRLPYHTTADKVYEFVLGRFMLVLGGSQLFSVIRYTAQHCSKLGSWNFQESDHDLRVQQFKTA